MPKESMGITTLQTQTQLAATDSRQIKKIVDQSPLERDIPFDH